MSIETSLPVQRSSPGAFRDTVEQLLAGTGIKIGGDQPHDLRVHDSRLYHRFLRGGTLAMGEAYMDGWWDCDALDELAFRLARAGMIERHVRRDPGFYLNAARARLMPIGSASRVQRIGETQQETAAAERCRGLPVEIRLQDYRAMDGRFDRVVSVGMFEHVGTAFYRTYMQTIAKLLKPDGLFLLHIIGYPHSSYSNPWMDKYYDRTLMAWCENFDAHWESLKGRFDERFRRMWRYYLLTCAGSFRGRSAQLWQWVLSRSGIVGGYKSIR